MLMVIWWTLLCWMLLLIVMWNVLCRVDNDKTTQNNVSDSLSLVCLVQRGSGIFIAPFPAHPAFCQRRAHVLFCHFCFVVSFTFHTSHTLSDIHNLRHAHTLRHPKSVGLPGTPEHTLESFTLELFRTFCTHFCYFPGLYTGDQELLTIYVWDFSRCHMPRPSICIIFLALIAFTTLYTVICGVSFTVGLYCFCIIGYCVVAKPDQPSYYKPFISVHLLDSLVVLRQRSLQGSRLILIGIRF